MRVRLMNACTFWGVLSLFVIGAEEVPALVPGKVLQLHFPELVTMQEGLPAACEVRVPENYSPKEAVPLLVWCGGGKGSHQVGRIPEIVDFEEFVLVALPYPHGEKPRLAVMDDSIDLFWAYQSAMLQRVKLIIPNISEDIRIVGGFSSGAHLVGAGLDSCWPGFSDYFNIYILHEGGTSRNMLYAGISEGDQVLVSYGEDTPCRGFQEYLLDRMMMEPGRNISVLEIPDTGHQLNDRAEKMIRAWVETAVAKERSSGRELFTLRRGAEE